MLSHNSDFIRCCEQELQVLLDIGIYLGSGPRYLLYYYGQLTITNDGGLMNWPQGPKVIVSVIKAQECTSGLSPARKTYLLEKLRLLENVRKCQSRRAKEEEGRLCLQRN